MSARFITVENRLGKLLTAPGGPKASEALAWAESALQPVRDRCAVEVDRQLAALAAALGDLAERPAPVALEAAYAAAGEVVSLAVHAGLPEVGEAAFSLCELLDRLAGQGAGQGVWRGDAVQVHLDALRLLRALPPDQGPAARATLQGLRAVAERVAA